MSALRDIADTLTEDFTKAVRDAENDDIAILDEIIEKLAALRDSKKPKLDPATQLAMNTNKAFDPIIRSAYEGNVGVEVKNVIKR